MAFVRRSNSGIYRQPQQVCGVDWSNPTSFGLVYLPIFGCGGIDATNYQRDAHKMTFSGSAALAAGPRGTSIKMTGAANDLANFTTSQIGGDLAMDSTKHFATDDWSMEVLLEMSAIQSKAHIFGFGTTTPETGSGIHRGLIAFNGSSPFHLYIWDGAGGDIDTGVNWVADGSLQHYVLATGGGALKVYRNGDEIASSSTSWSSLGGSGATQIVSIGGHLSGGGGAFTGNIYKVAIYNTKLTRGHVADLAQYPYQQFKTLNRRVYFIPSAAGSRKSLMLTGVG
jgi:hypothetical protein